MPGDAAISHRAGGKPRARGCREFADAEAEFSGWVAARSRATGDGPKAIFADGLAWLRERKVLLPGMTTLARLVASIRDESTRQMWEELARLRATASASPGA